MTTIVRSCPEYCDCCGKWCNVDAGELKNYEGEWLCWPCANGGEP